jgi:hypothetical protein
MNWYKRAQSEPPQWFPEAQHDYNPDWDYDVVIPDEKLLAISEQVINEINTKMLPQIGMGKAKAAYVKNEDGNLAKYVSGTAPYPVFVVDLEKIKKIAEQCAKDYDFDCESEINIGIRTTLFHEVGHAIQDWMGLEFDENEAEEFGIEYHETGDIWNFWDELV